MSDTFVFRRVPIPLRHRVRPRTVKVVVVVLAVSFAVSWFGHWVAASERASLQAAPRPESSNLVGSLSGAPTFTVAGALAGSPEDHLAQATLREALAAARQIAHGRTALPEVGPAQLARAIPDATFADGPSLAPQVVSVATVGNAWAAAVMSSGGRCFYIRLDDHGRTAYGSSITDCTGTAALGAANTTW